MFIDLINNILNTFGVILYYIDNVFFPIPIFSPLTLRVIKSISSIKLFLINIYLKLYESLNFKILYSSSLR